MLPQPLLASLYSLVGKQGPSARPCLAGIGKPLLGQRGISAAKSPHASSSCQACPHTQWVLFSSQPPSCCILTYSPHSSAPQREAPHNLEPTSLTGMEELSQRAFCVLCPLNDGLSFQGMYIFLHTVKGTPFETPDQGKARLLTHWEQMDYGVQFTASRKFLTITPIVL